MRTFKSLQAFGVYLSQNYKSHITMRRVVPDTCCISSIQEYGAASEVEDQIHQVDSELQDLGDQFNELISALENTIWTCYAGEYFKACQIEEKGPPTLVEEVWVQPFKIKYLCKTPKMTEATFKKIKTWLGEEIGIQQTPDLICITQD